MMESHAALSALSTSAIVYNQKKEYQKALLTDRRVLELEKKLYPPGHPLHQNICNSLYNLAQDYGRTGDQETKRKLLEEALHERHIHFGKNDPKSFLTLLSLVRAYAAAGEYDKGKAACGEALEILRLYPDFAAVKKAEAEELQSHMARFAGSEKSPGRGSGKSLFGKLFGR